MSDKHPLAEVSPKTAPYVAEAIRASSRSREDVMKIYGMVWDEITQRLHKNDARSVRARGLRVLKSELAGMIGESK